MIIGFENDNIGFSPATNMDTSNKSLKLHSCQEVDQIMVHMISKVPVVRLERLELTDWMVNKFRKKYGHLNEEPKCKKIKIEEEKGEIPKLILSKIGDAFQSRLKFSNPDMLNNFQEPVFSDSINKKVKSYKNQKKKSKKKIQKKSTSKSKMNQPVINPLVNSQINVCNIHSINNNFDSNKREVNCFDIEKPDDSKIDDALTFEPALSDAGDKKVKLYNNQKTESEKEAQMESTSKSKMNQPITNPLLVGTIKIRDVQSINVKYDSIQKDTNCIDKEKSDIDEINDVLTFEQLGTNEQTVQHFEKYYKKYISKDVLDTIVIINNTVFLNCLTVMDYMSRLNGILSKKDKYVMEQNIHCQTLLYIEYLEVISNVIKNNCFDIISVFEDSHFEHALLMFLLILFINLKVFGSDLFKDNEVILKKLQRLNWTSVEKNKFDHNKIQTTLKSNVFCSTYNRLSTFIGEGSSKDPVVIKFWELLIIPPMIKMSYFSTTVQIILNNASSEELKSLINQASNKIRLDTQMENDQTCSLINKIELEKLISLVNDSTQEIISSNDDAEPSTSGLTTLNNTIQQGPVQTENNENTLTQHIVHINPLRTLKPDTLDEKFPATSLRNIVAKLKRLRDQSSNKICLNTQIENNETCSLLNKSELEKLISIVNNFTQENTFSNDDVEPSTNRLTTLNNTIQQGPVQTENNENTLTQHIVHINPLRTLKPDTLDEKFPDTHTNKAATLIPIHVQLKQTKNSSSDTPLDLSKSCQTSAPIQNENLSMPHIKHTKNLKNSVINALHLSEKFPNTHFSNIPEKLVTNQICEIDNTLATVFTEQLGLHKSFNNSLLHQSDDLHTPQTKSIRNTEQNTLYENYHETKIKEINPTFIPNHQHMPTISPINHVYLHKKFSYKLNRQDRNGMIKILNMTTINVDSNTSGITMYFDRSEKRIGYTMRIQQLQWSINNNIFMNDTYNSIGFQLLLKIPSDL